LHERNPVLLVDGAECLGCCEAFGCKRASGRQNVQKGGDKGGGK
jgi:hypothetical protein